FVVLVNGNERKLTNEEVLQQFEDIINEEKYVLALFTKSCCQCVECVETEALLASTSHHLEDSYGVKIVKLIEHKVLQERYGIKSYPTVLYIRDGIPLLYDGSLELDALLEAIEKNREPLIKSLNDESFEHLTQAATGATTGDWLVLLYVICYHVGDLNQLWLTRKWKETSYSYSYIILLSSATISLPQKKETSDSSLKNTQAIWYELSQDKKLDGSLSFVGLVGSLQRCNLCKVLQRLHLCKVP
ncbi:uncharacterized protein LOC111640107, partial [Centruroides sculpturatus]|uniref:uncharacterized protein LOC111640107 n=1 Tax=Centruroides sculpturatus TaxID=218467 RepID=UPI000C6E4B6A